MPKKNNRPIIAEIKLNFSSKIFFKIGAESEDLNFSPLNTIYLNEDNKPNPTREKFFLKKITFLEKKFKDYKDYKVLEDGDDDDEDYEIIEKKIKSN